MTEKRVYKQPTLTPVEKQVTNMLYHSKPLTYNDIGKLTGRPAACTLCSHSTNWERQIDRYRHLFKVHVSTLREYVTLYSDPLTQPSLTVHHADVQGAKKMKTDEGDTEMPSFPSSSPKQAEKINFIELLKETTKEEFDLDDFHRKIVESTQTETENSPTLEIADKSEVLKPEKKPKIQISEEEKMIRAIGQVRLEFEDSENEMIKAVNETLKGLCKMLKSK